MDVAHALAVAQGLFISWSINLQEAHRHIYKLMDLCYIRHPSCRPYTCKCTFTVALGSFAYMSANKRRLDTHTLFGAGPARYANIQSCVRVSVFRCQHDSLRVYTCTKGEHVVVSDYISRRSSFAYVRCYTLPYMDI